MELRQLATFIRVAQFKSFSRAAESLGYSQSAVTVQIRQLEEELGIQFFVRSNRGVEFTQEGKEFLSYAVSLLEQKQRIESLYGEARNSSAPVRFSVSTQRYPFTEDAFLRMLRRTTDNRYVFSIREAGMDAVIDDVYDHRADIGVIFLTELTEKIIRRLLDARDLDFHEIAAVSPCIYVRKGHPLANRDEVTEEDLAGLPYVSFEHNQGVGTDYSEEYQLLSMKKPPRQISVNNRATMMNVLAATDAYTTGSGLLVEGITSQAVVTMPLAGKTCIRIGWIRPRNSKLTPYVAQFVGLLDQSIAESIAFTESVHQSLCHSGADT